MQSLIELIRLFWVDLQNGQLQQLGPWTYVLLGVLIVMQGPLATVLGGAAAAAGVLRAELVLFSGMVANLLADLIWYSVGHFGRVDWILRYGRWLGIRHGHIAMLKTGMHRHAGKILLVAKMTPGLAVPALIAAGLSRLPWRRWFPIVVVGETILTGTFVIAGYFAGESAKRLELTALLIVGLVVAALVVLILILPQLSKRLRMGVLQASSDQKPPAEDPSR